MRGRSRRKRWRASREMEHKRMKLEGRRDPWRKALRRKMSGAGDSW